MPVLVKIAIRNLREHKSKTLIIGIIIAIGITVMLLGNVFCSANQRSRRSKKTLASSCPPEIPSW